MDDPRYRFRITITTDAQCSRFEIYRWVMGLVLFAYQDPPGEVRIAVESVPPVD